MDYKKHDKNLDLENIELEVKSDNVKFDAKNIDAEVENLDFNIENNNVQTINSNDSVSSFNNDYESSKTSSENSSSSGDTIGESYDDGKQSDFDAKNDSFDIIDEEDEPINSDEMESNDDSEPNEDKKESDSDGEKSGEDKKESDSDGEKSSEDKKESESNGEKQGEEKKENKSDSSNENSNSKKEDNNSNEKNFNEKKNNSDDKTSAEKKPDNKKNNDKPKEKSDSNKVSDKKKNSNKHRKKRESLKDKWNNRPKNGKELANRAKSGAKKRAKNAFNNSKPGKAINNAKKAIKGAKAAGKAAAKAGKAAIKIGEKVGKALIKFFTSLPGIITLAVILSLLAIFIIFSAIFTYASPGVGGDVSDEENYSKYSEVDQKTIQKLKEISEKHPTGDPAYAMAATLYPYIEEMQSGNVSSLRARNNVEQEDEDDVYSEEEQNDNNNETEDDDLNDNLDDPIADDPYLELFRERKYRNKFKKLLKESRDGEEALTSYLKTTWFNKDAGYKELFDGVTDTEELADAIINDLLNQKEDFLVYFYDNCNTTNASLTPLNSAGNINESIQGDIYIRLRDYRQTGTSWVASDHFSSPILYGTDSNPLEFARYIMGVAYAEVGEGVKNEAVAKTIMVTAKSFTVGRYKSMGGEYPKPEFDEANNRTIIEMRGNVGDQDFCDVYEGCKEGTYAWSTRTEMRGSGDPKGPLSSNDIKNLEQWWNDIADVYVVNSSNGNFSGNQYAKYDDSCKKGSCVSQADVAIAAKKESDYMNILFNADNGGFDSDSYQAFNASTGGVYAVSTGNKYCPSSNITGSRQEIVNFAISMVGKIPYYFYEGQSDGYGALGHAINKNYDDNHFNEDASMTDRNGRNKYGLDCSGFVDFVFWNVLDDNLGNANTTILRSKSYKLSSYSDLIPGDLGFLSDDGSGHDQHVGIYIGNDEWVELNPNGVTKGEYPNFKVYYRPNILAELDQQENMDVVLTGSTVYENPIPGEKISNAYGVKGDLWSRGYHTGSDFGNNTDGKEIHSIGEGTVYCISCKGSSFGNHVVIEHADGYYSLYAHMSNKPKVIKGQKVNHSTILGNVGSTGNVTGPHLHLEFWKGVPWDSGSQDLNPANYIKL